jgi:nucleotide-binding universal stress UspA family protein
MTHRTVLVHIDDSPECGHRLAVALPLSRTLEAHVAGAYFEDGSAAAPAVAPRLSGESFEQVRNLADRQQFAEGAFRSAAKDAGIANIEWRTPMGSGIDAAVAHARCADLTVLSQPEPSELDRGLAGQRLAAVLLESGRPLLVAPRIDVEPGFGRHIVVAWDGGREASRAIGDALPLLVRAERVSVACLDPGATARGADDAARERLVEYLRRYGAKVHLEVDNLGDDYDIGFGDWLLSRMADIGADFLVMGGYGHPRWRERVLGGATRALLATMTVPVLMAH